MDTDSTVRLPVNLVRSITVLTIIVTLASAFVLASEIILILFLGGLFGIFLTKLSAWLSAHLPVGYRGSLAIAVVSLLMTVTGGATFFFVQINDQVEEASDKIDEGMNELRAVINKYPALNSTLATTPFVSEALGLEQSGKEKANDETEDNGGQDGSAEPSGMKLDSISEPVKQAAGTIGKMFKTTFGLLVNSLLIFFVGLFLAVSPTTYRDGIVRLIPRPKRKRATEVLDATSNTVWRWLIGRFGSMLVTGVGAFLLLLALGVPMASTIGILTALLTFVPNIGAAIALGLAILFALPQGTGTVGIVIGGYMALQLFESYVVTPLIQQKAVSLPPALLISFQAIMGVLFGFIGAAVASPVLAAGKTMVEMLYIEDYLESDTA
ncbi:AI-2E family transporter [Rubripirellula reticaptiva]|uniref:AI-2E family transporter n=1 Tax=Rubripirellula reticaptiva TaxID=2528013 RepID=UPI0016479E83|nr:AI-2E family transporter [Rubripirellula reticaptiva]